MPHAPLTQEDVDRIETLLAEAKKVREMMFRGKQAGVVTDEQIRLHDEAQQKLLAIKRSFIDTAH